MSLPLLAGRGLVPALALASLCATGAFAQAQATAGLSYQAVRSASQGYASSHEAKLEAVRDTLLSAQVPGAVLALYVKAGDSVKAGQELLRIDARMASQGAAASTAQVAAAQAHLNVATKEYERQQQLFAKRYISQAALDGAQAQWRAAQAQVQALQAQAGVAATQSSLHSIKAPYAGVIARVPMNVGDMAMPGTPLLALYDPSALRVTAQLAPAQVQQLRASAEVQLELPGLLPQRLSLASAQVQVLPTADALSHTVTVRLPLPRDMPGALPGMFARLWLPETNTASSNAGSADAAPPHERLLVPRQAVVRRAEMTGVYVQGANGQPQLRQVRLGPVHGEDIEILSGLRSGEQVALDPQKAAKVR